MNQEIELAERAMNNQDWPEAIRRWQKVFITFKEQTPAEAYVLLSMAHRFRGTSDIAEKIINQGISMHPENIGILAEHVEVAKARKDRPEEIKRLQSLNHTIQALKQTSNAGERPLDRLDELHRQAMYAIRLGKNSGARKHDDQRILHALAEIMEYKVMATSTIAKPMHVSGIWVCTPYAPWKSLAIKGQVYQAIDTVTLMFNDKVLCSTNVVNGNFSFLLQNAQNGLDPASKLTVVSQDGIVPFFGMHDYWKPEPPFVTNGKHFLDVEGALKAGYKLAKKGEFRPRNLPLEEKLAYLKTYTCLHDFFADYFDYPVLVSHGTLLGLYRDGEIIPYDDDFDCFYPSSKNNSQDVVTERLEILKGLHAKNIFFHMSHTGHIKVDIHGVEIDLMPAWKEGNTFNIAGYTSMEAPDDLFEPYSRLAFADGHVFTFAKPEIFLEHQYGQDWRVPDPGYFYTFTEKVFLNQRALWPTDNEIQLCMQAAKRKSKTVNR